MIREYALSMPGAVLVVLHEALPRLKDVEGWDSLTEGSELLQGDWSKAIFIDDEGRSHELEGIEVNEDGQLPFSNIIAFIY